MTNSQAIVNRSSLHAAPADVGSALTAPRPRWLYRRLDVAAPSLPIGRIGRYLQQVSTHRESSDLLARVSRMATELRGAQDSHCLSIGVTAAARRGNRQSLTAVALAGLWARWEYSTVLVEVGGRSSETGRCLRRTTPKIADILTAIECGQQLPMPQPIAHAHPNLDALADLGRFSLPRLADSGLLRELSAALQDRYQRVVWSLPSVGPGWSVAMVVGVLDRLILSVGTGKTSRLDVERLASEVADHGLHPLQIVWHQ